jgi:hypothetical protein
LLGDLRQEGQRGERDEEAVRGWASLPSEHRCKGAALRTRQSIEVVEHRRTELVQPAVGKLHLRFDPDGARDAPAVRPLDYELEERALARTGLASKHDHPAPAVKHIG